MTFDIYKFINQQLEHSFEYNGVKDRVYFLPLTDELIDQYLELNSETEKKLFAATWGLALDGVPVAIAYGEAMAVAAVSHADAPQGFLDELAEKVIEASDIPEDIDEDELTDEYIQDGLNSDKFTEDSILDNGLPN